MRESAVSAKPPLLYVWRETGAVRNARPSRGQAAPTRKRRSGIEDAKLPKKYGLAGMPCGVTLTGVREITQL